MASEKWETSTGPRKTLPYLLATVGPASVLSCAPGRHSGSFLTSSGKRKYALLVSTLVLAGALLTFGVLSWNNPLPFGTDGYWRIAQMRGTSLVVIAIVATCHAFATVAFHTATANRIITPSIMGFEALYVVLQTAAVFFLGVAGLYNLPPLGKFLLISTLMVVFATLLYGWILRGTAGNIHVMLLVGVILGGGMGSLSTFMQRMLDPATFDVLTARLFGNISKADPQLFPLVIPIVAVTAGALYASSRMLNLLALGRETSINLGLNHERAMMLILFAVSVLMAMTTSLVGPMTFLGFLVATLAYQLTNTYDHRLIFPVAVLIGYVVMSLSYFILRHVFSAQGAVTVIIELIGGVTFLIFVIRKGRL